jgi:hypothetical protein
MMVQVLVRHRVTCLAERVLSLVPVDTRGVLLSCYVLSGVSNLTS